jgi:hypothetical protein
MRGTDESDGAVVVIVEFSFKLKYSATLRSNTHTKGSACVLINWIER